MLDQYMQRIDDLDRIIQPVAARTQVLSALHQIPNALLSASHHPSSEHVREGRLRRGLDEHASTFTSVNPTMVR